jgi:hypothetical protein
VQDKSFAKQNICAGRAAESDIISELAGPKSLKALLTALVPEMTYGGMAVANGQDVGIARESLFRGISDQAECDRIINAARDYCRQDTLALIKLVTKLRSISSDR